MKLYNQGFPFLYNTFYQGTPGGKFCRGGPVPGPSPGYASAFSSGNKLQYTNFLDFLYIQYKYSIDFLESHQGLLTVFIKGVFTSH